MYAFVFSWSEITFVTVLQDEPVDRTKHWGDLDEEEEEEEEEDEEDEDAELGEDEMADGVASVDTISTYVWFSIQTRSFIVLNEKSAQMRHFLMCFDFLSCSGITFS